MKIYVASFGHDPDGVLSSLLLNVARDLGETFTGGSGIVLSEQTMASYGQLVEMKEIQEHLCLIEGPYPQADKFRMALEHAVKAGEKGIDGVLFIDFDRLLHWATHHLSELREILCQVHQADFTFFNRLPSAFYSHGWTQAVTEILVNDYVSEVVGKKIDIMSGCYAFRPGFLGNITLPQGDKELYPDFCGRVVKACLEKDSPWQIVDVRDGLEWETPSQFPEEQKSLSHASLARLISRKECLRRLKMAPRWIEDFLSSAGMEI